MTSQIASRSPRKTGRVAALLAYDGPIATLLLRVFQFFLVSVSFLACLVPVFAFHALISWQPTHLALWLGAASLSPVAPAIYAAQVAAQNVLLVPGETAPARTYWRAFAHGVRALGWLALVVSGGALIIGYDLALFGRSDMVFIIALLGSAALLTLTVGVTSTASTRPEMRPWALLATSARSIVVRPHLALSWLLLIAMGLGASMLPIVGGAAALFAPSLVACSIAICNHVLRFTADDKEFSS